MLGVRGEPLREVPMTSPRRSHRSDELSRHSAASSAGRLMAKQLSHAASRSITAICGHVFTTSADARLAMSLNCASEIPC